MRRIVLLILLLGACDAQVAAGSDVRFSATGRALDGDTVAADFRLLGVDAFESPQLCQRAGSCWSCGKAAQDLAARALREGPAEIRLTSRLSYGRPVATITVNGEDLGERLVRAGLAIPRPQYLKSDPLRADRYASALADARRAKAGAFGGVWIDPADWRQGRRLSCER
ncbi:thermonuclease family protein [Novosphingobium album (ex Liu et al. 2023)]|uniref:Thermonuclease family protein n=1 Tax=Novosphingobium album (ex Liu et al. 2023) TaxID=3031130 RepID=A0ABT5WKI4_9SPHN|nr:thermonuclease family protein [Novosphingobium album (ex Liu et al. 2023)]MDE8650553.1 thermonuclease family protein [Novosphingobium album (ex Liu et al. 2023)]